MKRPPHIDSHDEHWKLGWGIAVLVSLVLVGLASMPPLLSESAGRMVRLAFASVCHQIPERSPSVGGVPLAVCHRCYGIYWGILIAALAYGALRRSGLGRMRLSVLALGAGLAPLGLDWTLDAFGWLHNTPVSRFVTGGVFGIVAGWFFARAVGDAARRGPTRTSHPEPTQEMP